MAVLMVPVECARRQAPGSKGHLDLHKVVALAEQVGGTNHGFRCAAAPWAFHNKHADSHLPDALYPAAASSMQADDCTVAMPLDLEISLCDALQSRLGLCRSSIG